MSNQYPWENVTFECPVCGDPCGGIWRTADSNIVQYYRTCEGDRMGNKSYLDDTDFAADCKVCGINPLPGRNPRLWKEYKRRTKRPPLDYVRQYRVGEIAHRELWTGDYCDEVLEVQGPWPLGDHRVLEGPWPPK